MFVVRKSNNEEIYGIAKKFPHFFLLDYTKSSLRWRVPVFLIRIKSLIFHRKHLLASLCLFSGLKKWLKKLGYITFSELRASRTFKPTLWGQPTPLCHHPRGLTALTNFNVLFNGGLSS